MIHTRGIPDERRRKPTAPSPFVALSQVSVYYGDKPAFTNVDLVAREREVTALVGPSGSGKSSLLLAVNRLTDLIGGVRVTGSITVGGADIHGPGADPVALRRQVGMIFQKPNPFPMSIRKNLTLPLTEHGVRGRSELDGRVEEALTCVELWREVKDRLDAPATSLSGGQQQRLCLARALMLDPDVMLMDEPTGSLDPISTGAIEELILDLKLRHTVLLVTHDLAQARRLADHVGLMWAGDGPGRLIEYGDTERLFTRPGDALTAAYLGSRSGPADG